MMNKFGKWLELYDKDIFSETNMLYSENKLTVENTLLKSFPCYYLESATSSLDIAYELFNENKLEEWTSVIVGSQSAGRGQVGRNWNSPKGNLYAAIRLPKDALFSSHALAPIVGGILVQTLKNIFSAKNNIQKPTKESTFALKWTNDILIKHCNNYFKTGGILLEEKNDCLLCGIGINLISAPDFSLDSQNFSLNPAYISNFFELNSLDVNALWQRLVHSIYLCYISKTLEAKKALQKQSLSPDLKDNTKYLNYYMQRKALENTNSFLAFKNEKVSLVEALILEDFDYDENNNQITEYQGTLKEISLEQESLGALIVQTNLGRRTFVGGRLRPI